MSIKRRMRRAAARAGVPPGATVVADYEIVFSRLPDPRMPDEVREAIPRLQRLASSFPGDAVAELREWIARYPEVPLLYNYLAGAYAAVGDMERAEETAWENYRRNPNYLFARVNHARFRLLRGDLAGAAEALGPRLHLQGLYPHRNRFHISEFVGFHHVLGLYHLESGNRAAAEDTYEMLRAVAPDDPVTRDLDRSLHPLRSTLRRLVGR